MKKRTRVYVLLLSLCIVLSLCACSAQSTDMAMTESNAAAEEVYYAAAESEPMEMEDAELSFATTAASDDEVEDRTETDSSSGIAEKIIYSGHANVETTDFDQSIANLERLVEFYGGYVENSDSGGNTRRQNDGTTALVNRWANYTVRIPSGKFNDFMTNTGELIGNVTNSGRSARNVTSQYTDYEARLNSLEIQEERLLALLEESGDLESLITLEERLSEVRYEIESIERNLRNLDQRLAYSDIELYIQEVEIYTPTVPTSRSFGEKLSDAFHDGWTSFSRGAQNFVLALAEALPALILWIGILAAAVAVLRKLLRRRRVKNARMQTPSVPAQTENPSEE